MNNFIRGRIHDDHDDNGMYDYDGGDDDEGGYVRKQYKENGSYDSSSKYDTADNFNSNYEDDSDDEEEDDDFKGFHYEGSVYPYRKNEKNTQKKRNSKQDVTKQQGIEEKFNRINNNKSIIERHPPLLPRRYRVHNNNNNNNNAKKENQRTKPRKLYGEKFDGLNDDKSSNINSIDINKNTKSKSTIVKATVHVTINNENNK